MFELLESSLGIHYAIYAIFFFMDEQKYNLSFTLLFIMLAGIFFYTSKYDRSAQARFLVHLVFGICLMMGLSYPVGDPHNMYSWCFIMGFMLRISYEVLYCNNEVI